MPLRFKPAEGGTKLCGALIDVDPDSGRALAIERLQFDAESNPAAVAQKTD